MKSYKPWRGTFSVLLTILLFGIAASASSETFDELLGGFAQRRSGVCVMYAHAMALAEADPASFARLLHSTPTAWSVRLAGNRWAYVTRAEVEKSIANGFSAGEPDNLLTVFCIAVSKRSRGFDDATGMLDYGGGEIGWAQLIGTGRWTLYDDGQGPERSLKDGLDRLAREALPDGRPATPTTMGFGPLDERTVPEFVEQVRKCKLVGGHDFSVSRYDAARKMVLMRNPHNPKEIIEAPVELLLRIPAGIDFMEPEGAPTACK